MPDSSNDLLHCIQRLRAEHRELDKALEKTTNYMQTDQLQVQTLKRRKLKLKDTIARLESDLIPDLIA